MICMRWYNTPKMFTGFAYSPRRLWILKRIRPRAGIVFRTPSIWTLRLLLEEREPSRLCSYWRCYATPKRRPPTIQRLRRVLENGWRNGKCPKICGERETEASKRVENGISVIRIRVEGRKRLPYSRLTFRPPITALDDRMRLP